MLPQRPKETHDLSEVRLRSLVSAAALTSSILDGATGRSGPCLPGEVLGMLPGELSSGLDRRVRT